MKTCKLILVGGFLGAGKTSLLWKAAELLNQENEKVGLITNDQASSLVDTAFLEGSGGFVQEVSGSCFCCNFNGFAEAVSQISDRNENGTILAEPVGSCTDLSATIMQPLKDKYADKVRLAPLTVLADPARLKGILHGDDTASAYIGEKQFEEADIILINKADLLGVDEQIALLRRTAEKWPLAKVFAVSAKDGTGISEWLELIRQAQPAGTHLAEVDYDTYAAGEAAYGWLNASYELNGSGSFEKAAKTLLQLLSSAFDAKSIPIGHVKFILQAEGRQWIGNLTGGRDATSLRKIEQNAGCAALTVNA